VPRITTFILLLLMPVLLFGGSLEDIFQAAQPGMGYDRLIILEKDSLYTGGISIYNESVGIKGNGAIIELNGDSISVKGKSRIEIDGCVIKGGYASLVLRDDASCYLSHCTIYGNQYGIYATRHYGLVEIINTIISNNSVYGIAISEETARKLSYINMYQNSLGNYYEYCTG